MADERWVVQLASVYVWGVWHTVGPKYVSEDVARLAIKYHWAVELGRADRALRVLRVR